MESRTVPVAVALDDSECMDYGNIMASILSVILREMSSLDLLRITIRKGGLMIAVDSYFCTVADLQTRLYATCSYLCNTHNLFSDGYFDIIIDCIKPE